MKHSVCFLITLHAIDFFLTWNSKTLQRNNHSKYAFLSILNLFMRYDFQLSILCSLFCMLQFHFFFDSLIHSRSNHAVRKSKKKNVTLAYCDNYNNVMEKTIQTKIWWKRTLFHERFCICNANAAWVWRSERKNGAANAAVTAVGVIVCWIAYQIISCYEYDLCAVGFVKRRIQTHTQDLVKGTHP